MRISKVTWHGLICWTICSTTSDHWMTTQRKDVYLFLMSSWLLKLFSNSTLAYSSKNIWHESLSEQSLQFSNHLTSSNRGGNPWNMTWHWLNIQRPDKLSRTVKASVTLVPLPLCWCTTWSPEERTSHGRTPPPSLVQISLTSCHPADSQTDRPRWFNTVLWLQSCLHEH